MPLQDFIPYIVKTNDRNEIMIVVERKDIPRPLEENQPEPKVFGYIRFVISQGKAEFINFGSSFDDQCLNLGHTTKTEDTRLRGLQVAALVLCRENHHLRISANGCHWNFGFNAQASLYCRATPSKAKRETSVEGKPLKLCADIHEDVAVTIGHKGKPLSLEDFQAWLRDTIDLHETPGRIRTPSGDLLLDQYYQGHLYLRGIRVLQSVFEPGQAFRFGYNLVRGTVGRDRQPLVNVEEIMACIHSIWESAVEQAGDIVLPKYLEIFRGTPPPAEARGTDHLITKSTAKRMWESLIHGSAGTGVFYCLESRRNDVSITPSLSTHGMADFHTAISLILCFLGLCYNPIRAQEGTRDFARRLMEDFSKTWFGSIPQRGTVQNTANFRNGGFTGNSLRVFCSPHSPRSPPP
jgi:hypothetical protein